MQLQLFPSNTRYDCIDTANESINRMGRLFKHVKAGENGIQFTFKAIS